MQTTDTQKVGVVGEITFIKMPEHIKDGSPEMDRVRAYARDPQEAEYKKLIEEGIILSYHKDNNLIVTVGLTVLSQRLSGDFSNTGEVNYGALGDDATAPVLADIALGNENFRKAISSAAYSTNIAYLDFFFAAGEGTGTIEEFGNFIDGTGVVDSGVMWSHILTGTIVKSAIESLFISCQYTFN